MAVRIRLTRMGRRNRPYYRIVVADSRSRRDGRFIEQLGTYDPIIKSGENAGIKEDRVLYWLREGAQLSDTVKEILSKKGTMLKWHLENSNISDEKKQQELQKWEMARAAKTKKSSAPEEKPAVEETKEEAPKPEKTEQKTEQKAEPKSEPKDEPKTEKSAETDKKADDSTDK